MAAGSACSRSRNCFSWARASEAERACRACWARIFSRSDSSECLNKFNISFPCYPEAAQLIRLEGKGSGQYEWELNKKRRNPQQAGVDGEPQRPPESGLCVLFLLRGVLAGLLGRFLRLLLRRHLVLRLIGLAHVALCRGPGRAAGLVGRLRQRRRGEKGEGGGGEDQFAHRLDLPRVRRLFQFPGAPQRNRAGASSVAGISCP